MRSPVLIADQLQRGRLLEPIGWTAKRSDHHITSNWKEYTMKSIMSHAVGLLVVAASASLPAAASQPLAPAR
jgi:hypothetical protein